MKATKLTPAQRELFEALKQTQGSLRRHIKTTNTVVWRLMDKDLLEMKGHDYVLKATSETVTMLA